MADIFLSEVAAGNDVVLRDPAVAPSAADTVAPTFTGSITASGQTSSGGTLAWPAASDDTAVAGYEYSTNDGGAYTSAGNVLTVTLSGLAASTSYPIRVRAFDAAGNRSTHLAATLTTSAAADTTAPTLTGSITVSSVTATSAGLAWPAATDNVAVTGYEYSTNGGTSYTSAGSALSVALSGLTASTTYPVRVRAFDAAGNRSAALSATLTTSAAANTTRTVTFELRLDAGTLAANLTGAMVSFHAASGPHVTGAALYQSSSETTDASGIISFTFTSSAIAVGASGLLAVLLPDGRHFLGLVQVS